MTPRDVLCPTCGSRPGQHCTTATGARGATHVSRVRMAFQALDDPLPADKPLAATADKVEGGICPVCGALVPLMVWATAKSHVEWLDRSECVPRLRQHERGGSTRHQISTRAIKCPGSMQIPVQVILP